MDYFLLSKILRPFLTFSNLFIAAMIVLFFFRKSIFCKFFLKFIILIFFIIGIFPLGNFLDYHILSKSYFNKKNNLDFDSILVLSGNEARYLRAINFQKQNPYSKLIFTGGSGYIFSEDRNDELNNFKKLTNNLISDDKIVILDKSRNTIENLKSFKKANEKFKFEKTVLITSVSHYKRSLYISKQLELNITPYYYKKIQPNFSIFNSYQDYSFAKNWAKFDNFMYEIIGILRVAIIAI